jgi:hypothetical protein
MEEQRYLKKGLERKPGGRMKRRKPHMVDEK